MGRGHRHQSARHLPLFAAGRDGHDAQRGGSICNIVSPSGVRGQAGQCNYAASKGGMIAFTKSLAREVGRFNIRVNAVCPGVVPSPMSAKYIEKEEQRLLAEIPAGALRQAGGDRSAGCLSGLARGKLHHRPGHRRRWRTNLTPSQ